MRYVSTFKSQNQLHLSIRWSLKRQRLMSTTFLSTQTIKLLTEEPTACLLIITCYYLLMPLVKGGPVAGIHAISMANLMSEATALHIRKSVINVRALIISKPFVIPRLQQPRQYPALTGARSYSRHQDMHLLGATVAMAKKVEGITRRRRHPRSHQSRKHMRLHSRTWSYQK